MAASPAYSAEHLPQHTIAIQQVHSILLGVQHQGRDVAPLLLRAGIAPALLNAPLARVSQQQYAQLIRVLRRATRDELWGLASRPLPVGSFARGVRLMLQHRSLGEALREGLGHFRLLLPDLVARLSPQPEGRVALRLALRAPAGAPDFARLDFARKVFALYAYGLLCWLVARRLPLAWVDYTGAALPHSDTPRLYQAPLRHHQPQVALVFDAAWLALPVVQSGHDLGAFLAQAPGNLLVRYRDTGSSSERIRRLLLRRLDAPPPPLEALAPALGVAPQTLRRRLRDEGQGYQQLKDEVRRDAAIALLARPELALADVGARLGFSDPSTFHRAFKKWTGVAPGEYRQTRLRPG